MVVAVVAVGAGGGADRPETGGDGFAVVAFTVGGGGTEVVVAAAAAFDRCSEITSMGCVCEDESIESATGSTSSKSPEPPPLPPPGAESVRSIIVTPPVDPSDSVPGVPVAERDAVPLALALPLPLAVPPPPSAAIFFASAFALRVAAAFLAAAARDLGVVRPVLRRTGVDGAEVAFAAPPAPLAPPPIVVEIEPVEPEPVRFSLGVAALTAIGCAFDKTCVAENGVSCAVAGSGWNGSPLPVPFALCVCSRSGDGNGAEYGEPPPPPPPPGEVEPAAPVPAEAEAEAFAVAVVFGSAFTFLLDVVTEFDRLRR